MKEITLMATSKGTIDNRRWNSFKRALNTVNSEIHLTVCGCHIMEYTVKAIEKGCWVIEWNEFRGRKTTTVKGSDGINSIYNQMYIDFGNYYTGDGFKDKHLSHEKKGKVYNCKLYTGK